MIHSGSRAGQWVWEREEQDSDDSEMLGGSAVGPTTETADGEEGGSQGKLPSLFLSDDESQWFHLAL